MRRRGEKENKRIMKGRYEGRKKERKEKSSQRK
jgi:hypothetical protein